MQFSYNSDHPGLSPETGQSIPAEARGPTDFPPAQPIPCARITTRIFHPARNQVATVQNVIVRTVVHTPYHHHSQRRQSATGGVGGGVATGPGDNMSQDSFSPSDSSSDDLSDISDASMGMDDPTGDLLRGPGGISGVQVIGGPGATSGAGGGVGGPLGPLHEQVMPMEEDRAYWVQRTIREAIYGRVLFAVILKKRKPSQAANDNAEWEVTDKHCAVKEMSWQHIRKERDRLAEDPIKEVAAMQYLRRWHVHEKRLKKQQQQQSSSTYLSSQLLSNPLPHLNPHHVVNATLPPQSQVPVPPGLQEQEPELIDGVAASFEAIMDTNIMMPLDLLTDDRNLYSIMPYCDGGELFERLDLNERFTEEEARYWMLQVLNGLENLQKVGICHRDISLENLLVHESGALIIDMGMCLRIPLVEEDARNNVAVQYPYRTATAAAAGITASMQNMSMNGVIQSQQPLPPDLRQLPSGESIPTSNLPIVSTSTINAGNCALMNARMRRRYLIKPQGTCGKWIYMSPEIYKNQEPFDGFAVDMWAAGVILFLMITGFPPWERACQTDERFKYMSAGYLVQMLTEWNLGLSGDAMDLLQRMLFLDPKDRLSLDQVRAHPWMVNGPIAVPPRGSSIWE